MADAISGAAPSPRAVISIYCALSSGIVLHLAAPVTTTDGGPDFVAQTTRHLATTTVTLLPGANPNVDLGFGTHDPRRAMRPHFRG
jgi:hypothetical protein